MPSDALALVFWGSKRAQNNPKLLKIMNLSSSFVVWPPNGHFSRVPRGPWTAYLRCFSLFFMGPKNKGTGSEVVTGRVLGPGGTFKEGGTLDQCINVTM